MNDMRQAARDKMAIYNKSSEARCTAIPSILQLNDKAVKSNHFLTFN